MIGFTIMRATTPLNRFLKIAFAFLVFIFLHPDGYTQVHQPSIVPVAPDAMSGAFVRCIFKDSKGYIWFGTESGLIRFDGTNVYRYEHDPDDETSIPYNVINAIIEDGKQQLWVGTAQGLVRYDRNFDNFTNVDSIPGNTNALNNRYITALAHDRQGKLWIGTHGDGINVYDPKTLTFTYLVIDRTGDLIPTENYITSFLCVGDSVWAGTKGGTRLFHTGSMSRISVGVSDQTVESSEITQVQRDPSGSIWLSTLDGELISLTKEKDGYRIRKNIVIRKMLGGGGGTILTICPDKRGNLWVSGQNAGLNYLDTRTSEVIQYSSENNDFASLPAHSVRSVFIDDMGIVWIGTYNKGVFMIDVNAKKFRTWQRNILAQNTLPANEIRAFAEDREGNLWIACYGGGLSKYSLKQDRLVDPGPVSRKLATHYLSALRTDNDGNLWIGTWGHGVYKLDRTSNQLRRYPVNSRGFGDNKIFCIYQDKKNTIWVGTVGSGLFYFDERQQSFVSLNEDEKPNHIPKTAYVTSVLEETGGTLWVSTLFGLYNLERSGEHTFSYKWYNQNTNPTGSFNIQTLAEDAGKVVWFGTGDNGLGKIVQGAPVATISKKDGLPGNSVRGIVADANGNLWISTNSGLSKFSEAAASFKNYTKQDGLTSNEFLSNACFKASDGRLFFGTDNGFIAFHPDSIRTNPTKPIVRFTDFKLHNQSVQIGIEGSPLAKNISLTSEIELSHNQRSFVLNFVAVNYGQSSRNQYCYKLENFDNDWNCVGSANSATYTNLDPGEYIFIVKASNSDGVWSEEPARLKITIHPAPWDTWWAKLLYVASLAGIILFLIKIRTDRINIRNQLELERIAREKEHELSESKTQFFTNISHEFRTPLSLILLPLESLIANEKFPDAVRERLITVHKSADKMMRLVSELMDFNKLESAEMKLHARKGELVAFIRDIGSAFNDVAEKKKIAFHIQSSVPVLEGWFDPDKLEKIVVNVLSNAFKFTAENGQVQVAINVVEHARPDQPGRDRRLELIIIDNGMGISTDEIPHIFDKFYQAKSSTKVANPGTGIGLSLTKGLVERHHGSIIAESNPNKETRFRIEIPIDRSAYSTEELRETPDDPGPLMELSLVDSASEPSQIDHADTQERPQILVVEDNDELRKYIAAELRREYIVYEAEDGLKGFELACEKTPDLIISDILMPVKSGIELCQAVKADLKTSHIPFIMLTAKTTVEDQITGIETGADIYITKPFSFRFLIAHVRQIIKSRQELYSRFSHDVYLLPAKAASNEIDQAFLQKAIDYIIENIQDPQLGVDSIADLFSLSRMQVYRKLKALTGKSVVEFIRTVRVKQALVLMEKHQYTLSEIAYLTGFNTSSYFSRCFKEQYGKAPSEYLESKT